MADGSNIPIDEYSNAQSIASSQRGNATGGGCAECHNGNWIHIRYEYTEGDPVTDAVFVVQKPNDGKRGDDVIKEGVVTIGPDAEHKFVHVDLGDYNGPVEVMFIDDPTEPVPYDDPQPVKDERGFLQRCADAVIGGAEWVGEVAMGDFNEDMSTGQIITNAVVTAVPVVDQVADARDLIANGKALIWDKRYDEIGVWVGIFACLIGLVPSLGSLAKGVIKIVWKNVGEIGRILIYINKALFKTNVQINGYRFVKKLADELTDQIDFVCKQFDEFLDYCATQAIRFGYTEVQKTIDFVRRMARKSFDDVATEISDRITRGVAKFSSDIFQALPGHSLIVRRSMILVRQAYKSWDETMYRIGFDKEALEAGAETVDADAAKFFENVSRLTDQWYDELLADPNLPAYLRQQAEASPDFFKTQLKTFGSKPRYEVFSPRQSLFRVIGNPDGHMGGFWSKVSPPEDEAVWRARDAVKNIWNEAGAFIRVEVPPPPAGLVGEIAPQELKNHPGKMLRGGGEQVWLPGPREGAVSRDQVKDYWHTGWNDRAPTTASRSWFKVGNPNECDK